MKLPIVFQKQNIMRQVLIALTPACIGSIYFFGWVSAGMLATSIVTCVVTEWLFVRKTTGKVSEAVLVTATLFALVLPPTIPFWMIVAGGIFGVIFGKMAFGGFGANVFNPAIVCRSFLYITFPVFMTAKWIPAANFSDFPGGFAVWRFLPEGYTTLSAITTATPSHAASAGAVTLPGFFQLFLGNINGVFNYLGKQTLIGGGSLGETSALLLAIGGIYLLYKKTANWRLVLAFFITYFGFQSILHLALPDQIFPPVFAFLSGGAVLGGFFMVTDPVSAPKTRIAQFIYAGVIAIFTVLIRSFSLFAGGLMFSILLGNMFGPLIDHIVKSSKAKGNT